MFKITDLEMEKSKRSDCFYLKVEWTCEPDELAYFGQLNAYHRGVSVEKTTKDIEEYYKNLPPMDFESEFIEQADGNFLWEPSHPSTYDLGLTKSREIVGQDKISPVEGKKNTYQYREWVVDCPITRAMALQIARMQDNLDRGQDATFRSGSVIADFATLLLTIDYYWD